MLKIKPKALLVSVCVASVVILGGCTFQKTTAQTLPADNHKNSRNTADINADGKPQALATHISLSSPIDSQTVEPDNIWERVRNNFSFDLSLDNQAIRQQRNWYAKHPAYFERVSRRAERYLYHVVNQLEAHNMPAELALLPIVESAFDPFAYSHGRASGMWQFIPATGKRFGLQQDWWYDGRRDVVKSTAAAISYMTYLHKRFDGDWLLALAAYNSGEGNVNKAIRANRKQGKATDFWSLRLRLPRETQAYVPKLIALAQILSEPERYGVNFPEVADQPYFATVDVGSQIDLAQAAELAGIELDELYLLNPGFNQWATSPNGPHQLNVPIANAQAFEQKLASLPKEKRINWVRYTIKSGDTVSTIAARHRTTSKLLREINNLQDNHIRVGKTLFVPVASKGSEQYVLSASERLKNKHERTALSNRVKIFHIAQPGDSFWKIARRYDVGMRDVARWNNLGTTDVLREGQKLVIWSKTKKSANSSRQLIRKVFYKVRRGDSLARISQKFNLLISDIEGWNGINRKTYLQPGQSLKLYVDVTRASL